MIHSVWMHPWDLAGWRTEEFIDRLRYFGLDACNLALHYHAVRMLLPANRVHTIYEDTRGGAHYRPCSRLWLGRRLSPSPGEYAPAVHEFLEACGRRGFPVNAWIVLCHTDTLGASAPDCTVENAIGDRYPYALCPSNPEVREFCATLCGEIATLPAVASLDLEAAGFVGYDHGSVHEKSAIALPASVRWLLSLCFCPHCKREYGDIATELRHRTAECIRLFLSKPDRAPIVEECIGEDVLPNILPIRRGVVREMLSCIRAAAGDKPLNLRLSTDPMFVGGKAALRWEDLAGCADAATLSFFGVEPGEMCEQLSCVPKPAPVALTVGFSFTPPDTRTDDEFGQRYDAAVRSGAGQINFYALGLATVRDLERLRLRRLS